MRKRWRRHVAQVGFPPSHQDVRSRQDSGSEEVLRRLGRKPSTDGAMEGKGEPEEVQQIMWCQVGLMCYPNLNSFRTGFRVWLLAPDDLMPPDRPLVLVPLVCFPGK